MKIAKEAEAEYRAQLAAGREEVFGLALETLLNNDLERVKDTMIDAAPGEVPALQGEARGYKRFLKYLKERPVSPK